MEKSSKSHKQSSSSSSENRDKLSPGSHSSLSNSSSELHHQKSSFKPYESSVLMTNRDNNNRPSATPPEDRSSANRTKTPKTSHTPSQSSMNGRCESNQSASSQRASPSANSMRKTPSTADTNIASPSHRASSKESSSTHHPASTSQGSPYYSSPKLTDSTRESLVSYPKTSISIPVTSSAASYYSGYAAPGLPYPMDLMTASALMSPHHPMFKAAQMNPYLNYARMKVPAGNDSMLSGVCRDPYCTGCALSPHMGMNKSGSSCPAGCTQCDHSKAASNSYASQLSAAHGSVAAAYAHAQLAAMAAVSQLPYICNWIAGDTAYCGKRFSTSDDLLQHLRTHTASMPDSMLASAATAAAMQSCLPPSHPLFQRNYPTPPLSPLSTARYHPYGKPSSLMPSGLPPPPPSLAGMPMPHPSLAQYFSPYSMYGPRIGQPPSMHP